MERVIKDLLFSILNRINAAKNCAANDDINGLKFHIKRAEILFNNLKERQL